MFNTIIITNSDIPYVFLVYDIFVCRETEREDYYKEKEMHDDNFSVSEYRDRSEYDDAVQVFFY